MSLSTPRRYLSPLRILYFIIGLAVLALLLRQIDFANLARLVLSVRTEYLLLGGLAYLLKSMVRAYRFQRVQAGEQPPYPAMLRLTLASSLASQLLPFKLGELAYVYLVKKELNSSLARGVSSLMIIRVLDLLAIPVLFLLSALAFGLPANFSSYLFYILAFAGALLLGLAVAAALVRFFPRLLERWLRAAVFDRVRPLGRLRDALRKAAADLSAYRGPQLLAMSAAALVEWALNFLMFHALLLGIGLAPRAFDTVASVTFAALASVLPINSFGNFGTQEAGWATGLVLLGYPQETAITSGFATHLLTIGYMLVLGGFSWISYLIDGKQLRINRPRDGLRGLRIGSYPVWVVLAWLAAGVLLALGIPLNLPGGHVERVAKIFLGFNFRDLLGPGGLSFLIVLLAGGLIGAGLFALASALAAWQPGTARAPLKRAGWLVYALPMLLAWTVYLLAFFPAMLSPDSTHVWLQVQTGAFDNAHPLLYLVAVWLLTRLWNTPTVIAIAQILLLSLLAAWALGWLRRRGLPGWAAWLVSAVFALAPFNGVMVVTLWKDVPYGMAMLALSLLVLQISLEPRERLAKVSTGLLLGLAAAAVGLLRYNGLVIAPLLFAALALVYRRRWRVFALALAVFAGGWWLVQTPLNRALDVKQTSAVSGSLAMHHIAAHLHYETPISDADRAILERIMPLEEWRYYCYMANPVLFNPARDQQAMLDSLPRLNGVALRLLLENPTVDINQAFCAGSIVYRVLQPYDGYLYAAAIAPDGKGGGTYVDPNTFGIREAPVLPGLSRWLIRGFESSRYGPLSWLLWRPAFYLYLFLFCGAVFAMRARTWRAGLFLLPGVIHSGVLFAVSISQALRYQYPIYLLALFSLALLCMPCPTAPAEEPRSPGLPTPPDRPDPASAA